MTSHGSSPVGARPQVSVLTTVYNAAAYLPAALSSLFDQSLTDFEIVAVDDGSTDDSRALLEAVGDPRLRVVVAPGGRVGRTAALNLALSHARADYVAVLDADDIALPERLAREVAVLEARPELVLVGSAARLIDGRGDPVGELDGGFEHEALVALMAVRNPIIHSSVLYRRAAAVAAGGYTPHFPYAQDFGLWIALARHGRLAVLPEALVDVRVHPEQMTQRAEYTIARAADLLGAFRLCEDLGVVPTPDRPRLRRTIADTALCYADTLAGRGRRADALRWLGWTASRAPWRCLTSRTARHAAWRIFGLG